MALLILTLLIVVGLMVYYHHTIFDSFGVFVSVDVSGRRNVNEAEILDEWLIAHFNSYSDIRSYFYRKFDEWDDNAKKVLSGVLFFKKHREKQYYTLRERYLSKQYGFLCIWAVRNQIRHKQENYVNLVFESYYSLADLRNVCNDLQRSNFTLSRDKYFLKNQRNLMTELMKTIGGVSVTQRIKQVKQPRGGYIKPKELEVISLGEGADALNPEENVHACLMGLAVDYLTRFMTGASAEDAFHISLLGAEKIDETKRAKKLLFDIKGLDDISITNAVKLSGFDVCVRAGIMGYKPVQDINPDVNTIENVRTMVNRALYFLDKYGPKVLDGFTFKGGYTSTVATGDGDFTTADTLWDFKVSKAPVKKEHTLQLLMYWRMGLHSIHPEFQSIKYLGIYNPRMNEISRIAIADIPQKVIAEVESVVIGYNNNG